MSGGAAGPIAVSVSGGKDSTATASLALEHAEAARVRLVFADTGNEHQITLDYLFDYLQRRLNVQIETVRADFSRQIEGRRRFVQEKWPQQGVPDHVVDRALSVLYSRGIPFLDLCIWKGRFPSRRAQFCTQELKRYPLDKFMLDIRAAESWRGVRREESPARRHLAKTEAAPEGWLIRCPIVAWSTDAVFAYLARRGIETNPLYKLGMRRVGCMPCVNCGKDELLEISKRFPEYVDTKAEWEEVVAKASKRGGASFFMSPDKGGRGAREGRNIRERVEWAKTAHGGRQLDLIRATGEPAACSSIYGLCE